MNANANENQPRSGGFQQRREHTAQHRQHWEEREAANQRFGDGQRERLTIKCPTKGCDALIVRVERYHATVKWELTEQVGLGGFPQVGWDLGAHDNGTHFHLFCQEGHEVKRWGHQLPKRLKSAVYPGSAT